jgi:assimilatory nitrate reductase catalytic subunit
VFAAPGEARADWAILARVARRMGYQGFDWTSNAEVFAEHAAMTRFCNTGDRALYLPEIADYEAMEPFQWGGNSPFAGGNYSHPNGRARLIPVAPLMPGEGTLRLNTGRYRDQWHTMTRTGLSPRLSQHRREPLLEVHPDDASALGLGERGFARLGEQSFRVEVTAAQRPGEVYAPMHWTDELASAGRTNRVVADNCDPVSGQPGFKNSAVQLSVWKPDWRGFLVAREKPVLPADIHWVASRLPGGWLIELAGEGAIEIDALLPAGERIEAFDKARGTRRFAVRGEAGSLAAALFLTRSGSLPPRDWIAAQLGETPSAPELLAGRAATPAPDRGAIVCVCFDVGTRTILSAIAERSLTSVEQVGAALSAGTNCGSCRPAIRALLASVDQPAAA